jgi:exopolyphosphatase/guanosine-5'-triphosphate,3'-diphosphate pyrophosphatase
VDGVAGADGKGAAAALARTAGGGASPAAAADLGQLVYGAIDVGTNNCRLLVARPTNTGFRVVDAFSRIVRLGQGVRKSRRLNEDAMRRTLAALRICAAKLERRGVDRVRAVATEACRRAVNFEVFRLKVAADTGIALELISSAEEARLAMTGCAPLLDAGRGHALVFDIGGGSTELMWIDTGGATPALIDTTSLPFGVVTMAELHGGDRVPVATYEAMVAEVAAALAAFEARHAIRAGIAEGRVQMLGSSGTVTTLAGVLLALPRYDRAAVDGTFLDFADVRRISRDLLAMDYADRAAQPCIGPDRADLVVAGCAVLEAIITTWPVGRLRIADRGVREGILLELMAEDRRGR